MAIALGFRWGRHRVNETARPGIVETPDLLIARKDLNQRPSAVDDVRLENRCRTERVGLDRGRGDELEVSEFEYGVPDGADGSGAGTCHSLPGAGALFVVPLVAAGSASCVVMCDTRSRMWIDLGVRRPVRILSKGSAIAPWNVSAV